MQVKGAQTVGIVVHHGSLVVLHLFPSVTVMLWSFRLNRLNPQAGFFDTQIVSRLEKSVKESRNGRSKLSFSSTV